MEIAAIGFASNQLNPKHYNVDFEVLAENNESLVWGTNIIPIKEIKYTHRRKIYSCYIGKYPIWHMILPFSEKTWPYAGWEMIMPNGRIAPLFKS